VQIGKVPKRGSPRGNDLVRRYLWMAALSAVRFNPAVRALYARVVAKHPDKKAIAIGHAMRKLLHLAFAIWKSKKSWIVELYNDKRTHQSLEDRTPCGCVRKRLAGSEVMTGVLRGMAQVTTAGDTQEKTPPAWLDRGVEYLVVHLRPGYPLAWMLASRASLSV
jgi:hypothetical protein